MQLTLQDYKIVWDYSQKGKRASEGKRLQCGTRSRNPPPIYTAANRFRSASKLGQIVSRPTL